jgi:hypothetical protein
MAATAAEAVRDDRWYTDVRHRSANGLDDHRQIVVILRIPRQLMRYGQAARSRVALTRLLQTEHLAAAHLLK